MFLDPLFLSIQNISGFKSRSFQSFQEALERGEATHMMPVENAKEKLRRKEIKLEDIPYMQRGGSWVCATENCWNICSTSCVSNQSIL
jgi:hypothetical protein